MKKATEFWIILCICIYTNFTIAQNSDNYKRNFKLGIGLNAGLPFNDPYNFNIGGDLRLQYNISDTYSLCLTTAYNNLFVKDNGNVDYIPVKVGYKTFLFSNEFYVMGEFGGAFLIPKGYNNSLLFSPSIGYATKYVDISLRYEFLKDFPIIKNNEEDNGLGQLMIRLAYGFDI